MSDIVTTGHSVQSRELYQKQKNAVRMPGLVTRGSNSGYESATYPKNAIGMSDIITAGFNPWKKTPTKKGMP